MKYIDVHQSIRESKSAFLKKLPRFAISLIERIICQDELNRILHKFKDCQGVDFHHNVMKELNLTIQVEGLENLPEDRKCFFMANHPFGILDGMALTMTVLEKYGDLKAIGNEAFELIPNLRPYIALVNPYGLSSKQYVLELEKVYQSDIAITHFPAGEVSRRYHGKIQDRPWQKSFITRAVSCQRDIVPFYFHGRNSRLFYGINIVRRFLGIKMNIELALLPREFFRKKNSTIRFTIGKPIPWQTFDHTHSHIEWAALVKEHVYALASPEGTKMEFNANSTKP
jgi:putative hemolysin